MFAIDANLDQEDRWLGLPTSRKANRLVSGVSVLLAALAPDDAEVCVHTLEPMTPDFTALFPVPRLGPARPEHADLRWARHDAKAVNDRRFAHRLATRLGVALPGSAVASSIAELEQLAQARPGAWVAKAPWSASGRSRVRGDGPITGAERASLGTYLELAEQLVYEPWLERLHDVAVCGTVGETVELLPPHSLVTGARGTFIGISLAPPPLEAAEHDQLLAVADHAGRALREAGYRGPFGIDAFVYRHGGERRFHPLCEINARHTFGHVTHALGRRYGVTEMAFGHPPANARPLLSHGDRALAWAVL